jgi:hypothetical protein
MMKRTLKLTFFLTSFTLLAAASLGCRQAHLRQGDRAMAQIGAAGGALREAARDPLIPEPIGAGLELVGFSLVAGYGIWQRLRATRILERSNAVTEVLAVVVEGVEQGGELAREDVKGNVKALMEQRGIYPWADAIVQGMKQPSPPLPVK